MNAIIEMPPAAYLHSIAHADDAAMLHGLRAEIKADDSLHSDEKEELMTAIGRRFAWLNAQAVGPVKGRWD